MAADNHQSETGLETPRGRPLGTSSPTMSIWFEVFLVHPYIEKFTCPAIGETLLLILAIALQSALVPILNILLFICNAIGFAQLQFCVRLALL